MCIKKLKLNSGFSMASALVGSAVVAGLTLYVANLSKMSKQVSNSALQDIDFNMLRNRVYNIVSKQNFCSNAFFTADGQKAPKLHLQAEGLLSNVVRNKTQLQNEGLGQIAKVVNGKNIPIAQVGQKLGPGMKLTSLYFKRDENSTPRPHPSNAAYELEDVKLILVANQESKQFGNRMLTNAENPFDLTLVIDKETKEIKGCYDELNDSSINSQTAKILSFGSKTWQEPNQSGERVHTEAFTINAPGVLTISASMERAYSGAISNAGLIAEILVDNVRCGIDQDFEGTAGGMSFYASPSCIVPVKSGAHTITVKNMNGAAVKASWSLYTRLGWTVVSAPQSESTGICKHGEYKCIGYQLNQCAKELNKDWDWRSQGYIVSTNYNGFTRDYPCGKDSSQPKPFDQLNREPSGYPDKYWGLDLFPQLAQKLYGP